MFSLIGLIATPSTLKGINRIITCVLVGKVIKDYLPLITSRKRRITLDVFCQITCGCVPIFKSGYPFFKSHILTSHTVRIQENPIKRNHTRKENNMPITLEDKIAHYLGPYVMPFVLAIGIVCLIALCVLLHSLDVSDKRIKKLQIKSRLAAGTDQGDNDKLPKQVYRNSGQAVK